jgi:hypothetical protein
MADRLAERHITGCATEELKVGKFSNTDAGQMNLYLNYAREHWVNPEENPPVGLILCSKTTRPWLTTHSRG